MLLSYEWLKEFISARQSAEKVAEMLTMAGLEVDSIEKVGDDTVIDIDITPNRGDCLSVLGVARELGAITGKRVKLPRFTMPSQDKRKWIKVNIEDRRRCMRYAGRIIKGVQVGESPQWLKARLEKSGIRPINNVVDVTNYVLLEYGQPLHAFDLEKLHDGIIRVATPDKPIKFSTLDGIKRRLTSDMLLIWDGDTPIAVAGVMGGLESEVEHDTANIFLESACFSPSSIRRTASKLGIKTESSFRFERGIDILNVDKALDRASYLISELAGGLLCRTIDAFPGKYKPRSVKLRYTSVNDLLGVSLARTRVQDLIARTGAQVEDHDDFLHVEVPSHRNDIESDVDLIEEIARLYGYHRISAEPPMTIVEALPVNKIRKKISSLQHFFCSRGYYEVINYSFMNPGSIDILKIPYGDNRTKAVKILNPLKQEESLMRTTVVPSLIDNLIYNYHRGGKAVKIFEVSKVFISKNTREDKLPTEGMRIGGLFLDEKVHQLWKSNVDHFFTVKGDVDAMMKELSILSGRWERSKEPFLHPGRSADFVVNKKHTGYVGLLSPEIFGNLDLKAYSTGVVVFEFDLDILLSSAEGKVVYERFSRFPHMQRDISILVTDKSSAQDVMGIINEFDSDLIDGITVFDFYKGENIPVGKVSLAFSVTYRSFERTLSDEEIDRVHNDLVKYVLHETGGQLRS